MLSGVWIVTRALVLLESILLLTLEWYLTTLMRSMVVTVSHWVYFFYDLRIRKISLLSTDMRTESSAIDPGLFELHAFVQLPRYLLQYLFHTRRNFANIGLRLWFHHDVRRSYELGMHVVFGHTG